MANDFLDFLDFLCGLPAEGETLLLTKKVKSGAFPAFLPAKYRKGGAWYGNTGCFIIDRFNGQISAAGKNIEHVLVLVCDDVGTKSKLPPIQPTWVMETSKGNYQWGYAFHVDHQPTKARYTALYNAIAAAGYSDPGANNPVRNFRLPGSLNDKKEGFEAVLVEFNPERFFTVEQLLDAFAVKLGEVVESTFKRIELADDGNDEVLAWLSKSGLVLDGGNPAGWYGVVCPNAAEHTDGSPESRYTPATRSWVCMHGHCQHLNSKSFLEWVYEQGGPDKTTGLREELLASVMRGVYDKIGPAIAAEEVAEQINEAARLRELARAVQDEWHGIYAYIETDDSYFDMVGTSEIRRSTFNALYRAIDCRTMHGTGTKKIEASVWFDENRNKKGGYTLRGLTYAAGESPLCHRDGAVYGNLWRNYRPAVGDGDVGLWLDHCRSIVPDEAELSHIWDVMAYKLQHPAVKINHAILHAGRPGCGKDTMWHPFLWSIGGPYKHNVALVSNETLGSTWGYDLESEVMVVNELRQSEARDRRAMENTLKPIIAAPPEFLPVNRKGLHPYMMVNRTFVLAFSNDSAAIALPSDDRRWFVIWSEASRMAPDAARRIWAWYGAGGCAAVAGWLRRRDVSAFNPGAAPAMTEAKTNLIEGGRSMSESYLIEQMEGQLGDFKSGVIMSPFHGLCDRLSGSVAGGYRIGQAVLFHALQEAGWLDRGRVHTSDLRTHKRIFCHPSLAGISKSDLRRMGEAIAAPPESRLSVVK